MKLVPSIIKLSSLVLALSVTIAHADPITPEVIPAASASVESDALKVGNLVFISGQGGGDASNPDNTGAAIEESINKIQAIAKEMGGNLNDVVKLDIYTNDLNRDFPLLNDVVLKYFKEPFPTRTTMGAAQIPKNHTIEIDAVLYLKNK